MDLELKRVIKNYCKNFNDAMCDKDLKKVIIKDSNPIIWFGNLQEYKLSHTKVVTVALNPSCREFLTEKNVKLPNPRFKEVNLQNYSETEMLELIDTLNNYFDGKNANPYMQYFNQYEELLHAVNASYFRKQYENTAIHIDAYSAIATFPRWGDLDVHLKNMLKSSGKELYKELIDYLKPDIILISVDKTTFKELYKNWIFLEENEFFNYVYINAYRNPHPLNSTQLLLHGRNFNGTPFGGITRDEAKSTIKKVVEKYKIS